jgi:two-component system sensor histidine kinase KdpD
MVQSAPNRERPSPKQLLELARKQELGKLKVFLGAAPGVGKTFAMLSAARAQKTEGVDVVVGVVETHGRKETAGLLEGLEVLPRKPLAYRNREFMEFDLDAALARKPTLILIDEFAHTNAAGALHAKRYQDVQELMRAGIDVWTTLNIQHLESLTDVVQKITGVTVREVVPDRVLDDADEIVVVDLPAEELIQRLKEGKVYLPENARQAIDQFFRPANLTALRELALRRTTDRVDEQMLDHLRRNAIAGAWPTAERLLVCVGSGESSEHVVRTASRMATALKSQWVALQLQSADDAVSRASRRKTEKALRLAERLGADTVRLTGKNVAAEVIKYARKNNITQIVVGRAPRRRWVGLVRTSLADALIAQAGDVAVTVVPSLAATEARGKWKFPKLGSVTFALLTSGIAVVVAIVAGLLLSQVTPLPNVAIFFLLAVLTCGIRFGVASAVSASVLAFLGYNFFFIEPVHTFTVAEPYELVALLVFLAVSIMTASLSGRLHRQAELIGERADATEALYDFSRKLSAAAKHDDVMWLLVHRASDTVKGSAAVLLFEDGDLTLKSAWPPEDTLSTADWAAARWAYKNDMPGGRYTNTMPNARFHWRPVGSGDKRLGLIGIEGSELAEGLSPALEAELKALCDLASLAIERTMLVEQAAKVEAAVGQERLRNALLTSLSHDLRTPLSSIVGSVTSLRELGDKLSREERADLLAAIQEESERLSRFVSNLLDMTRIEAGALDVRREWIDVGDTLAAVADRAEKTFSGFEVETHIAPRLPLIRGDSTLLQQVIFNLLDNVHKFAGREKPARLVAEPEGKDIVISVSDDGPGIPRDALELIFTKFFRVAPGDGRAPGTGLGLAIARGVIGAMGGTIIAQSPLENGRGTRIVIRLPCAPGLLEKE